MGFAKKSASNRSCRNAPTRTTPAVNDLSEDMREKPDNLYEAIAARGEAPQEPIRKRRRPLRDDPHEKTVCKRFATVFVSFDALRHLRIFEPETEI